MVTGWALFFVIVGVYTATAQLFRVIDWIERPAKGQRRRARV